MSLTSASIDLANALKVARRAWEEACEVWDDPVNQDFDAHHWRPLEEQVRAVLQAMDRLTPVLAAAARDCS